MATNETNAANTEFANEIVEKFIVVLKKHISKSDNVERKGQIDSYGLYRAHETGRFKSEGIKVFTGNVEELKDVSKIDDVLRYYEMINIDIEGSQEMVNMFDSRALQGTPNEEPSENIREFLDEIDEMPLNLKLEGQGGLKEPAPSPAAAPAPIPNPTQPAAAPAEAPSPAPSPAPIPTPQERPPPQPGTQENISIYEIPRDNEYYENYTEELKIAAEQLNKFNEELTKPPGKSRMVIKPEDYKNAENGYKAALKRGKTLTNLNKQIEKGVEEIVQKRGGETKLEEINKEINANTYDARKIYLASQIETDPGKDPDIKDAKINIEGTITYLTQIYELIMCLIKVLNVVSGGVNKKSKHNKNKRISKKKSNPPR